MRLTRAQVTPTRDRLCYAPLRDIHGPSLWRLAAVLLPSSWRTEMSRAVMVKVPGHTGSRVCSSIPSRDRSCKPRLTQAAPYENAAASSLVETQFL